MWRRSRRHACVPLDAVLARVRASETSLESRPRAPPPRGQARAPFSACSRPSGPARGVGPAWARFREAAPARLASRGSVRDEPGAPPPRRSHETPQGPSCPRSPALRLSMQRADTQHSRRAHRAAPGACPRPGPGGPRLVLVHPRIRAQLPVHRLRRRRGRGLGGGRGGRGLLWGGEHLGEDGLVLLVLLPLPRRASRLPSRFPTGLATPDASRASAASGAPRPVGRLLNSVQHKAPAAAARHARRRHRGAARYTQAEGEHLCTPPSPPDARHTHARPSTTRAPPPMMTR